MTDRGKSLGKLVATYGIAPAHLQRAVFIVVLSFVFFLAMMVAFYVRQQIGYFVLATAFLLVYLVTLFSWLLQRKSIVKIFENGIEYRKFSGSWSEIASVTHRTEKRSEHLEVKTVAGKEIVIPGSIAGLGSIESYINAGIKQ